MKYLLNQRIAFEAESLEEAQAKAEVAQECARAEGGALVEATIERLPEHEPIERYAWASDAPLRTWEGQPAGFGESR